MPLKWKEFYLNSYLFLKEYQLYVLVIVLESRW